MPVSDNFKHIKYSYLISLLFWCYVMFKFCPSVHNVPNGQHRTPNMRNALTCRPMAMLAALENSSILFTSTCEVLIQTEFNGILRNCLLQGHLKCFLEISLCTLRRSLGPQIVTPLRRHLNSISHSSAHVAEYAHSTWVQNISRLTDILTIHARDVHNKSIT